MYYLNIFLLFSILGYSYETIFRLFLKTTQDYLLMGPWMPIYGFGLLISEFLNIFINIILLTIIEEIGGILVEKIFHTSFWNYEYIPLHLGPYVNIFVSIIWSLASTIIEFFLIPILTPLIRKIPKMVSYIILFLLLLDHVILLYQYFLR